MARKTKKDRRKKKKKNESAPPRRRRDGAAAFKGMLVGGVICVAFALVFFVRIGGETPFNHLVGLFEAPEKPAAEASESSPAAAPSIPARVGSSATNARKAPPLEKLTDGDKAGLDSLIKKKTKGK